MYVHKRDRKHRNIFIINVNKMKNLSDKQFLDLNEMQNFLLTYVIDRSTVPGKAESWTTIIDMDGVGISEMPLSALKNSFAET